VAAISAVFIAFQVRVWATYA